MGYPWGAGGWGVLPFGSLSVTVLIENGFWGSGAWGENGWGSGQTVPNGTTSVGSVNISVSKQVSTTGGCRYRRGRQCYYYGDS